MLSKRSIILDSLSTHRIDEGMIDSISKNSSSGSGDKLLKALLDCDIHSIPNKNLKSTTSFYNKSPFSGVDFVITFDFGGARECNRIEKFLFDKMGVGYCYIWKDGKSKIKLS